MRRLRTAGTCRAPRQGKRVDTKVSTLLTPTSFYFLVWRRPETGDRFENRGTAEDFFYRVFRNLFAVPDTFLLHRWFTLRRARHSSAAQLVSLEFTDGTCESIYLVAFIFAGAVYDNALTNCATRSCCACVDLITCVAEHYLTLRIGCERYGRKNPLPYPCFGAVTCRQSAPD